MSEKQKVPQGLNWIIAILCLGILGGIISLILGAIIPLGGIFSGLLGSIFVISSIVMSIIIFYGIIKRNKTLYVVALIWFIAEIIISAASLAISSIFLYLLFIWYFLKRKDYFEQKQLNFDDPAVKKQEKILKIGIIAWLVISIVIYSALPQIYEINRLATVMPGYGRMNVTDALELCREKQTADKDFCLYNMVEMKRKPKRPSMG
jgi:hypothetical protein